MDPLILQFFVGGIIVVFIIIFIIYRALVTSTDGAIKRLDEATKKTNEQQAELGKKLKEADEDLAKKQAESKALAEKMKADAQEESKAEREKLINEARTEGEEIIERAQGMTVKIKQEIIDKLDIKIIDCSIGVLNEILSENAKGAFADVLVNEFLEKLKNVDMSKINSDVASADINTVNPISDASKQLLIQIVKDKLGRDITLNESNDQEMGGGVMLKFGSMALDGSLKNLIREKSIKLKEVIEDKK